jgi:hypothetical protein
MCMVKLFMMYWREGELVAITADNGHKQKRRRA